MQLKAYRRDAGHSYAFGPYPTLELVTHRPDNVLRVILSPTGERNSGVRKLAELCERRRIPFEWNEQLVHRLANAENTYAVGVFEKYEAPLVQGANHVVLVGPSDMGNLGTVERAMLGFGLRDLALVRPAADLFDPRAVRASMGAVFRCRFAYFDTFDAYRAEFKHALYPFMSDGAHVLREVRFRPPWALVFGNESSGLPAHFLETGKSVRIPQTADIDSLSLPLAVGIGLYEATREAAAGLD